MRCPHPSLNNWPDNFNLNLPPSASQTSLNFMSCAHPSLTKYPKWECAVFPHLILKHLISSIVSQLVSRSVALPAELVILYTTLARASSGQEWFIHVKKCIVSTGGNNRSTGETYNTGWIKCYGKGLFINYIILFRIFPSPFLCHLVSTFGSLTPPPPQWAKIKVHST